MTSNLFMKILIPGYKMIGKAVPVNLAYEIAVAIKMYLDGNGDTVDIDNEILDAKEA